MTLGAGARPFLNGQTRIASKARGWPSCNQVAIKINSAVGYLRPIAHGCMMHGTKADSQTSFEGAA